jgi:hypothetical protein
MDAQSGEYSQELLKRREELRELVHDENEVRLLDEKVEAYAKRAEKELRENLGGAIPSHSVRVNLPANADPLAPQDPARRVLFVEHLAAIMEGAVLDRERLVADPVEAEPPVNARETLSARACGACRGSCCRAGGEHAYLTEETMARAMALHPDWTRSQLLDVYLSHLPAETTRDSCVYHGATGCGLPRSLRSPTCNRYQCAKLQQVRSLVVPEQQPPPVLALLFDHGVWARSALLDDRGERLLAEAVPRALPE